MHLNAPRPGASIPQSPLLLLYFRPPPRPGRRGSAPPATTTRCSSPLESQRDVCIFLDLDQLLHTCGRRGQASTAVCGNSSERLRLLFPNPQLLLLLPKIRMT